MIIPKMIVAFGLVLCLVGFYFLISPYITSSNYYSEISLEQISSVPGIKAPPVLPESWDVELVEKYDDGFTSPYVKLTYGNGITVRLKSGNWRKYNVSYQTVEVGDKEIDFYDHGEQLEFIFSTDSVSYSIVSAPHLRRTVEDFLVSIEEYIIVSPSLYLQHITQ